MAGQTQNSKDKSVQILECFYNSILQKLDKMDSLPENMKQQQYNILKLILAIINNTQIPKQDQQYETYDVFFEIFKKQVKEKQQKLLQPETNPDDLKQFYNDIFMQILKIVEQIFLKKITKKQIVNQLIKLKQNEYKEVIKQIQEYQFQDFQKNILNDKGNESKIVIIEWKQDIFDKINQSSNLEEKKYFKQLENILQELQKEKIFMCKLIYSGEKGDLFIGFQEQGTAQYDSKIIQIIYSELEQQKNLKLVFNRLKFSCYRINLEKIDIFCFDQKQFFSFEKKFKEYFTRIQENLNISQLENLLQITKHSEQQQQQLQYEIQNDIQFFFSFLQQTQSYVCKFTDQGLKGIMINANKQQMIQQFYDYILNSVFGITANKNEDSQVQDKQIADNCQQNQDFSQINIVEEQKNDKEEQTKAKGGFIDDIINYQFIEFQKDKFYYDDDDREWDESKFQIANQGQVLNYQKQILQILKSRSYFLCKYITKDNSKSTFIGYRQISDRVYQNYIFWISSNCLEVDRYKNTIEKFKEETNHFSLSQNVDILILKSEVYIQYHNLLDDVRNFMINWSKKKVQENNFEIPNSQNCNRCNSSGLQNKCQDCRQFRSFSKYQDSILNKLLEKQYLLKKYLNRGGFGIIFEGYKLSLSDYQEVVFKFQFDEDVEDELKIMQIFEFPQHVCKNVDFIQVNKQISILILEKCQQSLYNELNQIKNGRNNQENEKEFPKEKLGKMFIDLIEGLIIFRIYNILHLDIKPSNILISKEGNYVYTDFGLSTLKNSQEQVKIKGNTKSYASPEQINKDQKNINFQSDVFSLGKTFQIILETIQPNDQKLKNDFMEIVQNYMIQNDPKDRKQCIELHKIILEKTLENDCFLLQSNIFNIQNLNNYDDKKDTSFFQKIKIQYYKNYLDLFQQKNSQQIRKQCKSLSFDQIKAQLLYYISTCYLTIGDKKNSKKYSLEHLQISNQIFNKNYHPQILNSVGNYYKNIFDIKKTLENQLEPLQMRIQIFKQNNQDIMVFHKKLGSSNQHLCHSKKTLVCQLEQHFIIKQIYKQNHPSIAVTLNNVGLCYRNLGDNQKALKFYHQSLKIRQKIYFKNNLDIAISLYNIGSSHQQLGDSKQALLDFKASLEVFKQTFQKNHPSIATSLNKIGSCHQDLGDYEQALKYQLESLQMFQKIFQEVHPDIAISLNNVGLCYQNLCYNKKALEYLLKSLQIFRQIFKKNHPDIAISLNNIAICYEDLGDNVKASEYNLKSLQTFQKIFKKSDEKLPTEQKTQS